MGTSVETLQGALAALVGGHARPAETMDAVAGVQPHIVVEPQTEEQVASVLALADREGLSVLPRGGGTQLGIGAPPRRADIVLSLARLNAILEHAPHDQTVSVQAGLSLTALQAALGKTLQWLALDPVAGEGATIGGLIATNASGSRRLRYGGVRDQVIGIRVALADGTLAKGGGKVVKNVAGYDLPKLFTGSLGTLGVIVGATFRLYPLPTASRTVLLAGSVDALGTLAVRITSSTLVPTVIDLVQGQADDDACVLAVRFESGVGEAVLEQCAALMALAGDQGNGVRTLDSDAETRFWSELDSRLTAKDGGGAQEQEVASMLLKASVLPTEVARWLAALDDAARRHRLSARWRAHAGHGIIMAQVSGAAGALGGLTEVVEELRAVAREQHGSVVALDVAPELPHAFDPWGPVAALEVMRRLKEQFDPHATLNPGRFVGGI